jgi:ketopantoate reductase
MSFQHIGIVGAGGWGTALALLLHEKRLPITLWGHNPEEVRKFASARENTIYLPGVQLPEEFRWTSNLADLSGCDLVLMVTPSKATREVAAALAKVTPREDACATFLHEGGRARQWQADERNHRGVLPDAHHRGAERAKSRRGSRAQAADGGEHCVRQ